MADIDFELVTPSAADATDVAMIRRGAAAPYTAELVSMANVVAGAGGVIGPASVTDDRVAGFDGTTGKLIKEGTVTLTALADAVAEIITARGDRPNLNARISAISGVVTPNSGGFVVGNYYDNGFRVTGSSSLGGAINRMELAPFMVSTPLRIDQIGVECTTPVASATGKCLIYTSGADGWPDALVYETATPLDFSGTGYKFEAVNILFDRDRVYWVGVRHSSTATLRAIGAAGALPIGLAASTGAAYFTTLRRTLAYATAAPNPWAFTSTDLTSNVNPTSIRMRSATV